MNDKVSKDLRKKYILALSIIAILLIFSQIVIQIALVSQQSDGRVINLAGRQRMLSQRITKAALILSQGYSAETEEELRTSLGLFYRTQKGLVSGDQQLKLPGENSDAVIELFKRIQTSFDNINNNTNIILDSLHNYDENLSMIVQSKNEIVKAQSSFLIGMDEIVFTYEAESEERIKSLRTLELLILLLTFLTLTLEIIFIFRPFEKRLKSLFAELHEKMDELATEITHRKNAEKKLEYYAYTDSLTGVLNRRLGIMRLEYLLKVNKRHKENLTVCFIDLDGLKDLNDTYGHAVGDSYIKTITEVFSNSIRDTDIVCRYGGDEFLIIFPDCEVSEAQLCIDRIENQLEKVQGEIQYKFSYGLHQVSPEQEMNIESIIEIADMLMYQQKLDKKKNSAIIDTI